MKEINKILRKNKITQNEKRIIMRYVYTLCEFDTFVLLSNLEEIRINCEDNENYEKCAIVRDLQISIEDVLQYVK